MDVRSGIGQPLLWSSRERGTWLVALFTGSLLIYAARNSLPVSVVEISQELHWDKKISGVVLSSFYWGYALTQIIGGQLSDKHGGGVVLMSCGMGVGVAIILIPLVAMLSNHLVILSNLINGICQGMFFPAVISLLSSHVSDEEQNLFNGIIHSGPQLGSIFCGFLSYILLFRYGWEYIFVFVGVATILWACLMRMLMKGHHNKFHYQLVDSTSNNSSPSASGDKEKAIKVNLHKKETSCVQLPWRYIIKEPPVLALFWSSFCEGFYFHSMMAWMPTYFHEVFPDQARNAWMSNTFPWIAKALSSVISGVISSYLFKKGVSKTVIRKLMEGTSLLGVATCLATIGLVGTNTLSYSFSLSLILLAFFCQGFETSGTAINAIDLAPSYSGFIYGISNTIGALSGIFAVSMTGHLLHAYNSWNIIFLLISSVSLSGFVIFTALGSGKRLTHIDS